MVYIFYAIGFLAELVAWSMVASLGFWITANKLLGWVLTIFIFVAVIVLWGLFMSPKADFKVPLLAYYIIKLALYALAFGLIWRHTPQLALLFIVAVAISEPFLHSNE